MTQPLTRDLRETIRSLEVSEAELRFQADRLSNRTDPDSEQEKEHLADLVRGYNEGARYVRILINYHTGRERNRSTRPSNDADAEAIDQSGRARAYISEG